MVIMLLLAANLLVFAWEVIVGLQSDAELHRLISQGALVPARFTSGWRQGDVWLDLLTATFLHGGLAHLLGNLWFLWVFGRSVETRVGSPVFLLLYTIAAVGAALLQVAVDPRSTVPMIGASGAISGVLGAYFVLFRSGWVLTLVPWIVPLIPVPAVIFLALWFLLQMGNGIGALLDDTAHPGGGIAWWAHAGGFVAGVVVALLLPRARGRRGRRARRR